MNIKNIYLILLSLLTFTVIAEPYKIILTTQPSDAAAFLRIVHPFNNINSDYYNIDHRYNDCYWNSTAPDWGVKSWEGDNPNLKNTYKIFTADTINDPGDCIVKVEFYGAGSVDCTVTVTNWPNIASPLTFTKTLNEGDNGSNAWTVTSLHCADDIKLHIQKAKQNLLSYKLKVKATFENLNILTEASTFFRSSIDTSKDADRTENWLYFTNPNQIKIKKAGSIAKFGKPVQAFVKAIKNNKITVKGQSLHNCQNVPLRLFIALGGQSGFEYIYMDDKAKYKMAK